MGNSVLIAFKNDVEERPFPGGFNFQARVWLDACELGSLEAHYAKDEITLAAKVLERLVLASGGRKEW